MKTADNYIPGTCNIGAEEIKVRKNSAILFGFISIAIIAAFLIFPVHKLWRLILFVPLSTFIVGVQQWRNRFCVMYGIKGLLSFGEVGSTDTVIEAELRKQDRAKAWRMILTSLFISAAVTVAFYFLP